MRSQPERVRTACLVYDADRRLGQFMTADCVQPMMLGDGIADAVTQHRHPLPLLGQQGARRQKPVWGIMLGRSFRMVSCHCECDVATGERPVPVVFGFVSGIRGAVTIGVFDVSPDAPVGLGAVDDVGGAATVSTTTSSLALFSYTSVASTTILCVPVAVGLPDNVPLRGVSPSPDMSTPQQSIG